MEQIAFAAPRTEEMTRVAAGVAGAGITGVVEGVIVKMAPAMGAASPILTWGTLLGVPLVGVGGALFTRGLLGDLFQGIAAGGVAIIGYSLPAMLVPAVARGKLTPAQIAALNAGANIKQLGAGTGSALERAQAGARVGIEI